MSSITGVNKATNILTENNTETDENIIQASKDKKTAQNKEKKLHMNASVLNYALNNPLIQALEPKVAASTMDVLQDYANNEETIGKDVTVEKLKQNMILNNIDFDPELFDAIISRLFSMMLALANDTTKNQITYSKAQLDASKENADKKFESERDKMIGQIAKSSLGMCTAVLSAAVTCKNPSISSKEVNKMNLKHADGSAMTKANLTSEKAHAIKNQKFTKRSTLVTLGGQLSNNIGTMSESAVTNTANAIEADVKKNAATIEMQRKFNEFLKSLTDSLKTSLNTLSSIHTDSAKATSGTYR